MPQGDQTQDRDPFVIRVLLPLLLVGIAIWVAFRSAALLESTVAESSNFGYVPNPAGTAEFLRQLPHPTFADAGADAVANAKGLDVFLYRHLDKAHRAVYGTPWVCWNQGDAGTCVSFTFGLGSYAGQAVDWTTGRMPKPPKAVATEPIYGGSRTQARLPPMSVNYGGDGSYGGAAARWIAGLKNGTGGILYRQAYGEHDLSTYSIPLSREWGKFGVPMPLAKLANENKAQAVAQVGNWEELAAALESGYPVAVCSTVGYGGRSKRDADGFIERGSSWAHAMLVLGIRHKKNGSPRDGALIQNSWGPRFLAAEGSGKWPPDQPDGSFWTSRANIEAALAQGDSFAIGGIGFTYREIDHGAWLMPAPTDSQQQGSEK